MPVFRRVMFSLALLAVSTQAQAQLGLLPQRKALAKTVAASAAVTDGVDATTVSAQATRKVTLMPPSIRPGDVEPHVRFLAGSKLAGRSGSTAREAAAYIRDHYQNLGIKPLFGDSYCQDIPAKAKNGEPAKIAGQNVGAWIQGSDPAVADEFVIVSAHYDHLGVRNGVTYAGADDNATGVAMVLELAKQIAVAPRKPRRSIAFVNFDLEEKMLWGSRWFVAHPPWPMEQVHLFITADMIGRSLANLPLPMVFVLGAERGTGVKGLLDSVSVPNGLEAGRLGVDLIGVRSDYGPFADEKVPFLFFSTGEHPDYHSARDVPDRVDYAKVARISTLIHRSTLKVANSQESVDWVKSIALDLDEPTTLNRITTLMLAAEKDKAYNLTDFQRMIVSHVNSRSKLILDNGQMTTGDRAWLTRMAKVLLFSVF